MGAVYSQSSSLEKNLIGAVEAFATINAPKGWLKCNGAELDRILYSKLFAVIGEQFGAGDGLTTFNLPDMRGYFPRGFDDGRGVDVGRVFGSNQEDEVKSHRHSIPGGAQAGDSANSMMAFSNYPRTDYTNYEGGEESRPKNIALLYCIKY